MISCSYYESAGVNVMYKIKTANTASKDLIGGEVVAPGLRLACFLIFPLMND